MQLKIDHYLHQLRHGPDFGRVERIAARLLFALVVWSVYDGVPSEVGTLQTQEKEVGLAHFFDLTFLADREFLEMLRMPLMMGLMAYVMGMALPIMLPMVWLIVVLPATLAHSQGAMTHSTQLVALVLTGQTVWAVIWGIRWFIPGKGDRPKHNELFFRQLVWISIQIVAAGYLVTGVTKMWESEGQWVNDAEYFPVQLEKSYWAHYYNDLKDPNLDKDDTIWGVADPIAQPMKKLMQSANWSRFFLACGLLLEFAAVLALLGRRWALAIGLALIFFHLTIGSIMALKFNNHIYLIAIFFVNAPYWIMLPLRRLAGLLPRESAKQTQLLS